MSDWRFSNINVSNKLEKNPQSEFFNNRLGVEEGGPALVVSSVIKIGKWSLSYISGRTDQDSRWASNELEKDRSIT